MENEEWIILDIIEKLKYAVPDIDKKITLNKEELINTNFNFFELYGLYLILKKQHYELIEMKPDSITVKKKSNIIHFRPQD